MGINPYSSLMTGIIRHIIGVALLLASMGLTTRIEAASFTLVTGNAVVPAVVSGTTQTLNALVQSASGASGVNVTLQIIDSSGVLVARQDYLSQNFTAGQQVNYSWSYVIPPSFPAGTSTLAVGVFSSDWTTTYLWNGTVEAFMAGTGLNTITADYSYYQGSTSYWAFQNAWNDAGITGGEDITVDPAAFQSSTLVRWTWPLVTNPNSVTPIGYPEIVFGCQTGVGNPSPNGVTPIPTQINSFAQLGGTFDITIGGPDLEDFDILWETFTVSAANNGTRTAEIAIFLHAPQATRTWAQSLSLVGSYTGSGISGMVYQTTSGLGVPYVVLLPAGDVLTGNVDLLGYLNFVASQGIISTDDWMTDYELGAEPYGGVGYYQVNSLNYTWSPDGTPSIISPLAASGTANQAFSYQIAASNGPTSYSASGLPTGLIVNASTGLISGTPSAVGTWSITLSATNSTGNGGTVILALTVTAPAPTITSFTPSGGPVGTSVTISGTGFASATAVTINGAAAAFTVLSNVQISATIPVGANSSGLITVYTPQGNATSPTDFTDTNPQGSTSSSNSKCGNGIFGFIGLLLLTAMLRRLRLRDQP